jgi:tRNA (guanine37-N1)-methyltransferase
MKIQIISLFPEMFEGVFDHSMLLKAKEKQLIDIELIKLRDFGIGTRRQVDDTPYGGGSGMLLKPEPINNAIEYAKQTNNKAKVILLTPRGETYTQSFAKKLAKSNGLILICGRYEGVDERVAKLTDLEISVGNYVLTGGEIPAMMVVDSVTRLLPGVLGGECATEIESFHDDEMVEYPQYTRPDTFQGMKVPEVLLSGNHRQIAKWRRSEAQIRTKKLNN